MVPATTPASLRGPSYAALSAMTTGYPEALQPATPTDPLPNAALPRGGARYLRGRTRAASLQQARRSLPVPAVGSGLRSPTSGGAPSPGATRRHVLLRLSSPVLAVAAAVDVLPGLPIRRRVVIATPLVGGGVVGPTGGGPQVRHVRGCGRPNTRRAAAAGADATVAEAAAKRPASGARAAQRTPDAAVTAAANAADRCVGNAAAPVATHETRARGR